MANDFLVFGGAGGANVINQADYAALGARTAGFSAGVAQSAQLNKVWRQSSIMAAVLAQFISDQTGQDVLDDGTIATTVANLKNSMPGRLLRTTVYTRIGGVQQVSVNGGAFTTTGAGAFTPLAGTNTIFSEMVGGGGGSGGVAATAAGQNALSSGGGAGAYAKGRFASGFSGIAITVGAEGAAGAAGVNNGGNGGTSSLGALMSAPGGLAGVAGAVVSTGAVAVTAGSGVSSAPSGANILGYAGQSSGFAISLSAGAAPTSGGGGGPLGTGGPAPTTPGAKLGSGYGVGASGNYNFSSSSAAAGGAGQPGFIKIEEYA